MTRYYDHHTDTHESNPLIMVQFEDGRKGVAIFGALSGINAYDFENHELTRTSIGGTLDTRNRRLQDAVNAYNARVEASPIKRFIKHAEVMA